MNDCLTSALDGIVSGQHLVLTKSTPVAAILALIRLGRGNFTLLAAPTAGLGPDLLAAAGALSRIETGAMVVPGFGAPTNLGRGVAEGRIAVTPSACPVIEMQLVAGAMGLRFTEVPGIGGTALLADRSDFRVIADPFDAAARMVVAPALNPDAALIHGKRADRHGNVVASIQTEDRLVARAARHVVATVERIADDALDSLAPDEEVIPALLIDRICEVPRGAAPWGCPGLYDEDAAAIRAWFAAGTAGDTAALQRLMDGWAHG